MYHSLSVITVTEALREHVEGLRDLAEGRGRGRYRMEGHTFVVGVSD